MPANKVRRLHCCIFLPFLPKSYVSLSFHPSPCSLGAAQVFNAREGLRDFPCFAAHMRSGTFPFNPVSPESIEV